jgi:hypothetical protein
LLELKSDRQKAVLMVEWLVGMWVVWKEEHLAVATVELLVAQLVWRSAADLVALKA